MDLATIEMEPEVAEEKWREYRAAVKERHDDEDAAIAQGYKALARGHRLIELSKTLTAGGFTTRGAPRGWFGTTYVLPNLAVGWADQGFVYATGIHGEGGITFYWNENVNDLATRRNVRLPQGTFDVSEVEGLSTGWSNRSFRSMIPKVPPPLRPARGLSGYLVLWEAEWAVNRPAAPRDPALLKRIGGDLYAVVAVWDLTELERAVLSGRE